MFGMYEISSTGDDLWLTYREMLEVAEEAGIVDKKLMNPLYGALNKLAEGKDAEGFSEEDAKALAIAKFEASKFGDAAGAHAEVLRSLVALMDTARTIIDERKTIKRDGTLGNAGKAELLLPGLKVEVYDSDSSKNRVVYSDRVIDGVDDAGANLELAQAFLAHNYKKSRSYSNIVKGVIVTERFRRHFEGRVLREDKFPTTRSVMVLDFLNVVLKGLRDGQILPYDLALELFARSGSDSGKKAFTEGAGEVAYITMDGVDMRQYELVTKMLGLLSIKKQADMTPDEKKADKARGKPQPATDLIGRWMFWKVVGQRKESKKGAANKIARHAKQAAAGFEGLGLGSK